MSLEMVFQVTGNLCVQGLGDVILDLLGALGCSLLIYFRVLLQLLETYCRDFDLFFTLERPRLLQHISINNKSVSKKNVRDVVRRFHC